ncbi:MAG: hypothetical protein M1819_006246 [Sarea resinae]|nr:MAG: hypothetical protein M1819_006246 [Sarea resinae]
MSQTSNSPWPQPPYDAMGTAPDDDFSNLFDLGDIQLDFPSFDAPGPQQDQQDRQQDVDAAMDTSGDMNPGEVAAQGQPWEHDHMSQQSFATGESTQYGSTEALMGMGIQEPYQHQHQHQPAQQLMQDHEYHHRSFVPPTPDSIEMHGGVAHYRRMDPQQDASIDRYQQMKDDLIAFTPLVSPAVTPLDTQFQLPEFTVPGAYFSPLTSPALEAQNHSAQTTMYSVASSYESSMNSSPVERNSNQAVGQNLQAITARKQPKRRSSASTRIRQSPIVKPLRRKGVALSKQSPMINAEVQKTYSSGSGSISPEPLSEALMAPPPAPRHIHLAQSNGTGLNGPKSAPLPAMDKSDSLCPATPSSLMRLQKQSNSNVPELHLSAPMVARSIPEEGTSGQPMNDICLPEAAISSKSSSGRPEQDDQTTPTVSARNTPRLGPSSASISNSAYSSPQLSAISSPNGSISTGKHTDLKRPGRGGKRNSVSSVQVSPALRPKISPSIKPLLPEGAVSAESSAALLAKKSNYQNLLDGTHVPGVSYPPNLSTNLTSKRTSHKIAEQGRRNRINNALQEIASLLPTSPSAKDSPGGGCAAGSEKGAGAPAGPGPTEAQLNNSKAATVEMAIEYIKQLQMELKETKGKLEKAERDKSTTQAGSATGHESQKPDLGSP